MVFWEDEDDCTTIPFYGPNLVFWEVDDDDCTTISFMIEIGISRG